MSFFAVFLTGLITGMLQIFKMLLPLRGGSNPGEAGWVHPYFPLFSPIFPYFPMQNSPPLVSSVALIAENLLKAFLMRKYKR
jgi:hypothetical protein